MSTQNWTASTSGVLRRAARLILVAMAGSRFAYFAAYSRAVLSFFATQSMPLVFARWNACAASRFLVIQSSVEMNPEMAQGSLRSVREYDRTLASCAVETVTNGSVGAAASTDPLVMAGGICGNGSSTYGTVLGSPQLRSIHSITPTWTMPLRVFTATFFPLRSLAVLIELPFLTMIANGGLALVP